MPECSFSNCSGEIYRHHRGRALCQDCYQRVLAEWLTGLADELQDVPWQEIPEISTPTAAQFVSSMEASVDELAEPLEADPS